MGIWLEDTQSFLQKSEWWMNKVRIRVLRFAKNILIDVEEKNYRAMMILPFVRCLLFEMWFFSSFVGSKIDLFWSCEKHQKQDVFSQASSWFRNWNIRIGCLLDISVSWFLSVPWSFDLRSVECIWSGEIEFLKTEKGRNRHCQTQVKCEESVTNNSRYNVARAQQRSYLHRRHKMKEKILSKHSKSIERDRVLSEETIHNRRDPCNFRNIWDSSRINSVEERDLSLVLTTCKERLSTAASGRDQSGREWLTFEIFAFKLSKSSKQCNGCIVKVMLSKICQMSLTRSVF
jgi:hypothetical protein